MGVFLIKRLAFVPLVLFGLSLLLFGLLQQLSPEMRAALYVKDPRQLGQLDEVIRTYHLADPIHIQYASWLKEVLKGNLGWSETAKMTVAEAIKAYFPATFELTAISFAMTLFIGLWLGTISAVHKDRFLDHVSRIISITGTSFPTFVIGLVLLMIFYGKFGLLPPGRSSFETQLLMGTDAFKSYTGMLTIDGLLNGNLKVSWDGLKHIILPALTLTYVEIALLVRVTRSSMLEELGKDYVRTARAKGLTEDLVVKKHARKNAMIPVITLSSILFVALLGGVAITETVFDYPGIGRWGLIAAQQLDIPGVLGFASLSAVLFVLGNTLADALYAIVDPRIRIN
ncbi:MAG: ABC transporter permease [Elusimicrobia bacterium]|nr:ABC transporter permease [Elusimicrobiota bacterium]